MKKKLYICVGSSCHLKGSYKVLQRLKSLIEERGVGERLELVASFCLGKCSEGVSMKLGEEYILNANKDNIDEIFDTQIMPKL